MPSIALPLHATNLLQRNLSLTGIVTFFFMQNKINFFQGSKCTLQKWLIEACKNTHLSEKEPFSFFLHFCSVPPCQEQQQQSIFCLEWKVHLHSLQAQGSVFKGNKTHSSWNSFLHSRLLLLNWEPVLSGFPWMCHCNFSSSDANITYWPSLPL